MTTPNTISDKLKLLFSNSQSETFSKREIILASDDMPHGVYYLAKGFVKMNSTLADGREITLNIFKPGTYFPMMWALSNLPNTYYFQAITKTELNRISKDVFVKFMNSNPDVLFEFTNRILIGLDGLLFNINNILSGQAYHRIVSAILMLSKRFGEKDASGQVIITLPITHQDLADIAAITRETASINIKQLENLGLISQKNRKLSIPNLQKLEAEANITSSDTLTLPSL
jgi:CRP/FNR family transcriptional regulator, cyclic AMP receptor protein